MDNEQNTPEKGKHGISYVETDRHLRLLGEQCRGICDFPHSTCMQERYTHLFCRHSRQGCSNSRSFSCRTKLQMKMVLLDMVRDSHAILQKANSLKEKCELALQEEEK